MLRDDKGFTLVELLITIIILAALSLSISAFLSSTSKSLANSIDNNIATQSALRSAALMRYDFSGSTNVHVFGQDPPSNRSLLAAQLCTSDTTASSTSWGSSSTWASVPVRLLFSLAITDVNATGSNPDGSPSWADQEPIVIGYEIRQAVRSKEFELWRVSCTGSSYAYGLTVSKAERVVGLGFNLSPAVAGTTTMKCTYSSSPQTCPIFNPAVEQPRPKFYSFSYPFQASGQFAAMRALTNPLVGRLASKVGAK